MIQKILQLVDSLSQRLQGLLIPGGFLAGCLNHQEYGGGGASGRFRLGRPVMKKFWLPKMTHPLGFVFGEACQCYPSGDY